MITMRRKGLLALVLSSLALGVGAGPAIAGEPFAGQAAEQVAENGQSASSSASSTQVAPSNTNIDVRVLSPGDGGSVSQSNSSSAESAAGNLNETAQSVEQSQYDAGAPAIQEAAQQAVNDQQAQSEATSEQVHPKNTNVSVRVLSPGDDGDVDQSNSSAAESAAYNGNETGQSIDQDQEGHGCGCGSTGIQAAAQEAISGQQADSSAESKQVEPQNRNVSVRVLSPGDDGDVSQSNDSAAASEAVNENGTAQGIEQSQHGSDCGCPHDSLGIQAAAQKAVNWQEANSSADSTQLYPSNKSLSFDFLGYGDGGDVKQSNSSLAESLAANRNALEQAVSQNQGG